MHPFNTEPSCSVPVLLHDWGDIQGEWQSDIIYSHTSPRATTSIYVVHPELKGAILMWYIIYIYTYIIIEINFRSVLFCRLY